MQSAGAAACAHARSAGASGITVDSAIDSCGVIGASPPSPGLVKRTDSHCTCVDAAYVEWDHDRGTFGVWTREELPAAAAAASGTLRGLQRDHSSGVELPIEQSRAPDMGSSRARHDRPGVKQRAGGRLASAPRQPPGLHSLPTGL